MAVFMRVAARRSAGAGALVLASLVVACGFPSVSYEDVTADGGAATSSASPSGGTTATSTRAAAVSASSTSTSSTADASSSSSTGSESSESASTTTSAAASTTPTSGTAMSTTTSRAPSSSSASSSSASSSSASRGNGDDDGGGNGNGKGNGKGDAASPPPPCPDADDDGYTAASCGGTDCNDGDARAHPGVTGWVTAAPTPAPGWVLGDWNCDGTTQFEYPGNIDCTAAAGTLAGSSCTSNAGFTGASPGCGVAGDTFTQCQAGALLGVVCADGPSKTVTQGCL